MDCGGAHTIAFMKKAEKIEGTPLLHECANSKFGCRALMLRSRIGFHERLCRRKRLACPNMASGCDRDDLDLNSFDRHVAACRFRLIDCKCGLQVVLNDYKTHLENICLSVEVECELCGTMTTRGGLEEHMETTCPETKIKCDKCKIGVARKEVKEEKMKERPKVTRKSSTAKRVGGGFSIVK